MHHHFEHFVSKARLHMAGRQRGGGHGFGHFAAGFGDPGMGGRFRTGRKLGSGDLQLLILGLLADHPRHGYEIIKALEERSAGFYSPSPGMVYPALTYLEEIGHATVVAEGTKKLYHITDTGRAHLAANQTVVDAISAQLAQIGEKMARIRKVFSGEESAEGDGLEGEETGRRRSAPELRAARHELRAALHEKRDAPREEQTRIAALLQQAADAIRGK